MSTLFSKIVRGEIPCYKVHEDDNFLAFLDINPLKKGHTLVIPKMEVDYIFDMEDEVLADMILFAKIASKKIKSVFPCEKVGMAVIGLEVPHAHIHLIPINSIRDMDFSNEKLKLEPAELLEISKRLQNS